MFKVTPDYCYSLNDYICDNTSELVIVSFFSLMPVSFLFFFIDGCALRKNSLISIKYSHLCF